MNEKIDINSTLRELELLKVELDCTEKLFTAFKIFEGNSEIPGIIVTKNGNFFRMLSKSRFYQVMSKQYMFDLFSRRPVQFFFDDSVNEENLIFETDITIVEASRMALLRDEKHRYDPIIVKSGPSHYLLSIHTLLLAQNAANKNAIEVISGANEFKKDVLRIVSHDLRGPLSTILGFGELIIKNNYDNTEIHEYIKNMLSSANQMNSLINEFLTMAINDSLDIELSISEFNVQEAVCFVISSLYNNAKAKNQCIKYVSEDESLCVTADKNKFIEVMFNLISNAIKYSENGKQILIDVVNSNNSIMISVKDEGLGFTEADLLKVFGKFQKLSAQPTANEPSVGLGLYIVKKIMTKHGGKVWIDSEPGKGSTFYLTFPACNLQN